MTSSYYFPYTGSDRFLLTPLIPFAPFSLVPLVAVHFTFYRNLQVPRHLGLLTSVRRRRLALPSFCNPQTLSLGAAGGDLFFSADLHQFCLPRTIE